MSSNRTTMPPWGPKRRHISVTLVSGDPIGLSIRRLANSDAIVLTCPRDALFDTLALPEAARAGVYLLLGPPEPADGRLQIYVGRTSKIARRMMLHHRDASRDFFVQAAIIVSADNQLTEEQTEHIEAHLANELEKSELVSLLNGPLNLDKAIRDDLRVSAEHFLDDALLLLGPIEPLLALVSTTAQALRRRAAATSPPPSRQFRDEARSFSGGLQELRRGDAHALAIRHGARRMRVLAGARVASTVTSSLPDRYARLRAHLLSSGGLVPMPDEGTMLLVRDIDVSSPTAAACLVLGASVRSGYRSWKPIRGDRQ